MMEQQGTDVINTAMEYIQKNYEKLQGLGLELEIELGLA